MAEDDLTQPGTDSPAPREPVGADAAAEATGAGAAPRSAEAAGSAQTAEAAGSGGTAAPTGPTGAAKAAKRAGSRRATKATGAAKATKATKATKAAKSAKAAKTTKATKASKATKAAKAAEAAEATKGPEATKAALVAEPVKATPPDTTTPEPVPAPEPAAAAPDTTTAPEPAPAPEPAAAAPEPAPTPEPAAPEPAAGREPTVEEGAVPAPAAPGPAPTPSVWARAVWEAVRHPRQPPHRLAELAVEHLGPAAAQWADRLRHTYPDAPVDRVARLAAYEARRYGWMPVAATVGGRLAPLVHLVGTAWVRALLVLRIAAAYGHDPSDPARVDDVIELLRLSDGAVRWSGGIGAAVLGLGRRRRRGRDLSMLPLRVALATGEHVDSVDLLAHRAIRHYSGRPAGRVTAAS